MTDAAASALIDGRVDRVPGDVAGMYRIHLAETDRVNSRLRDHDIVISEIRRTVNDMTIALQMSEQQQKDARGMLSEVIGEVAGMKRETKNICVSLDDARHLQLSMNRILVEHTTEEAIRQEKMASAMHKLMRYVLIAATVIGSLLALLVGLKGGGEGGALGHLFGLLGGGI